MVGRSEGAAEGWVQAQERSARRCVRVPVAKTISTVLARALIFRMLRSDW